MSLRPLGIGELIDATIRFYRENLRSLVMIAAAIHLPLAVIRVALSNPTVTPFGVQFDPADLVAGLLEFTIGFPVGVAAATAFVAHRWLGRPATPESALRGALGRIGPLLLATLALTFGAVLVIGAAAVAIVVPIAGGAALARLAQPDVVGVGAILLAVVGILAAVVVVTALFIRFGFWAQIIVLEQVGPIASLRRSWSLTQGAFWRIVGVSMLLTTLFSVLVAIVVAMLAIVIGIVLARGGEMGPAATTVLNTLYQAAANILLQPFLLTGFTLLYIDLRVRKEAFDLQVMADELQSGPSNAAVPGS